LDIIQAYFSFWGRQNLQTFLINMKIPITDVRQVLLNGEEVEETDKKGTSSVKSPVDDEESTNRSSEMNYKMVAGIVAGGVVLMAAVLSALFIRHRRQRRKRNNAEDAQNYKHVSSGSLADDDIYSVNNNNFNPDILKDMNPSTTVPATPSPDKTLGIDSDSDGDNSPVSTIPPPPPPPQSPIPPPPPQPVFRNFEDYENQDNDDDDDDDVASEACASDADIVSVTESLLYFENNKGPLFSAGGANKPTDRDNLPTSESQENKSASSTPPSSTTKSIAMTGKTSVRTPSANFKYDASRLDAVISNAQGLQKEEKHGK
jgi:hypothetical protein